MNKLFRSTLLTSMLAAGLAACGDSVTVVDPPPPPPPPPPTVSVTVGPDGVSVGPGQTVQMSAAVTQSAGCAATVTWSVSDAARASVSATGLVTINAAATSGAVAVRATATCATGGASANGVATLNVVGTTVTAVSITPATATVNAGTSLSPPQTVQLAATVTGTNNPNQGVTWSSLDAAVASVSASGVVTANNTATPGNVVIKACSTVAPSTCGTMALTVVVPSPATVQIQSVTFNSGGNVVPVNLVNVFGQIEIALNIETGSRNITRVDALIGGQVVASQTFASGSAAASAGPDASQTTVSLSTSTTQLRQSGGIFVPVVFNGNSAITANLYVSGSSTPIASNAVPVVMNNPDRLVRTSTASLIPTSSTPSVVSGGNTFYAGSQTTAGFAYIAFGKAVPATVTLNSSICGASANLIPGSASATGGIALSGIFGCVGVEGGNTITGVSAVTYAAGAVGPDGTPLTPPVGISSVGTAFQLNGENRWNMIFPAVGPNPGLTYVDNKAPSVWIANPAVALNPVPGQVAFNDLFDQQWINGAYTHFAQYVAVTAPNNDLLAIDGGVGLAANMPEVHVFTGPAGSFALDSTTSCTATKFDPTAAAETLTSNFTDGYRVCTFAVDLLGNAAGSFGSNYFGLDRGVPVARLAGSTAATPTLIGTVTSPVSAIADNTTYGNNPAWETIFPVFPGTAVWGLEGIDNRAGFNQNLVQGFPSVQAITKLGPNQAYTAVGLCAAGALPVPPGTGFAMPTVLSDQYVRSTALDPLDCGAGSGYYKFNGYVVDRAGNQSVAIVRNFVRDDVVRPSIAGVLPQAPLAPGVAASFTILGSDDVELIGAQLAITQPIISGGANMLLYPNAAGLGTKWDLVLSNVVNNGTVSINPFLFRIDETCLNAGVPYAGCAAPAPASLDFGPVVAANPLAAGAPYPASAAGLPTQVTADVFDVANQFSGAPVTTPFQAAMFNPTTGIIAPWPGAPVLASWSASIVGTTAVAVHKGTTSIQTPYFTSVALFRINAAGTQWVLCGVGPNNPGTNPAVNNPYSNDQGVNRFWNYTIQLATLAPPPPPAPQVPVLDPNGCSAGGGQYRVMGIKGGAGLFTQSF